MIMRRMGAVTPPPVVAEPATPPSHMPGLDAVPGLPDLDAPPTLPGTPVPADRAPGKPGGG
jgi:hypothetical protein